MKNGVFGPATLTFGVSGDPLTAPRQNRSIAKDCLSATSFRLLSLLFWVWAGVSTLDSRQPARRAAFGLFLLWPFLPGPGLWAVLALCFHE